MPTVILIDLGVVEGNDQSFTSHPAEAPLKIPYDVTVEGISKLLDYIGTHSKFEFVSLVFYSNTFDVAVPFVRKLDNIKMSLSMVKCASYPPSSLEAALYGVENYIIREWGGGVSCNVILVTNKDEVPPNFTLPFSFAGNFIISYCLPYPPRALHQLRNSLHKPHVTYIERCKRYDMMLHNVKQMYAKIGEKYFTPWTGSLICGNLNCKVTLTPNPEPYTKVTDFETTTYTMDNSLEVCGFIELQHLGSPAAVSRHLVIPCPTAPAPFTPTTTSPSSMDTDEDDSQDDSQLPSFCVLLHGALKVENMAALCSVGNDWYGVLFSWADSKKKANLMLSLLYPGEDAVPWLGDLNNLEIPDAPLSEESFPIKPIEKRSYTQNCMAWIRQPGLQSDIQKILRHARKIPEKTQQFYKELNRVRRAAICLGFVSLIEGLSAILDRECTLLPGGAHPACALQLTHAAQQLREPFSKDPKYHIMPMKMSF